MIYHIVILHKRSYHEKNHPDFADRLLHRLERLFRRRWKQQLETAQFEEKQNNREHAIKLYEEVVTKHAGTPNAKIAQERLNALKSGK